MVQKVRNQHQVVVFAIIHIECIARQQAMTICHC